GTVTPEGVRLDVRLTHELLAAVTGARRPSVTTALRRLAEHGQVRSLPRSRWLLLGTAPAALQEVRQRTGRVVRKT
ncbi:MAG TPA: helix-turn-helix domain-containing protein, partial [Solirubrobacteraceae bacterium]|nr:helix-turn-helix domain-containing protein [Solirubrobacteraceae bacterium]